MVLAHAPGSVGTHEGHREKREYRRIEYEDNEAVQWASLVFFVVFVCILCSCVPMAWPCAPVASLPAPHGNAWMTEEHWRREQRSMAARQATQQATRQAARQAMQLAALMGQFAGAEDKRAARAARAGTSGGLAQAQALAAEALPAGVQLKDNNNDVFVLQACMCGRDGHVALRLDCKYTPNAAGGMDEGNSMVQWPFKVVALTLTASTHTLEIKCGNFPIFAVLDTENERRARESLPALAEATDVEWEVEE